MILWGLEMNDDGAMTDRTEGLQHRAAGRYQEAAAVYEASKNKRSEEQPRGQAEWDEDSYGTTQSEALRRGRDQERQWLEVAGPREQKQPESSGLGEDNPTLLRFYNCRHSCGHEFMSETIREMHEASCQAGEEDNDPAEEDPGAESGEEDGDGDARQHPPHGKQQSLQQPQQQSQQQQQPDQDGQEGGEDEPERKDEHDDDCFACDTCEKVYNMRCLVPPLRRCRTPVKKVPNGTCQKDW
jgi:hypothetical protein